MSRSETLKLVETYLSRARDVVERTDDDVLRYLIDTAISEARDLIGFENSEARRQPTSHLKREDRKKGRSSVLHLLTGEKAS